MKTKLTLWIPKTLPSESLKQELSITLWAALTATTDVSIEDSKTLYTQILKIIESKEGNSLILTEHLSRVYNSQSSIKYDEKWLGHFTKIQSHTKLQDTDFGLVFCLDGPSPQRVSIKRLQADTDTSRHEQIIMELEQKIKISIEEKLSKKPFKYFTPLGNKRTSSTIPISKNELENFFKSILNSYHDAQYGQFYTLAKELNFEIEDGYREELKKQINSPKNQMKKLTTPFSTRVYGVSGCILIYLNKGEHDLSNSTWLDLKSDFNSIKKMKYILEAGGITEIILNNDTQSYEYTYGTKSKQKIQLHIYKRSNERTKLPDKIKFQKK